MISACGDAGWEYNCKLNWYLARLGLLIPGSWVRAPHWANIFTLHAGLSVRDLFLHPVYTFLKICLIEEWMHVCDNNYVILENNITSSSKCPLQNDVTFRRLHLGIVNCWVLHWSQRCSFDVHVLLVLWWLDNVSHCLIPGVPKKRNGRVLGLLNRYSSYCTW